MNSIGVGSIITMKNRFPKFPSCHYCTRFQYSMYGYPFPSIAVISNRKKKRLQQIRKIHRAGCCHKVYQCTVLRNQRTSNSLDDLSFNWKMSLHCSLTAFLTLFTKINVQIKGLAKLKIKRGKFLKELWCSIVGRV